MKFNYKQEKAIMANDRKCEKNKVAVWSAPRTANQTLQMLTNIELEQMRAEIG